MERAGVEGLRLITALQTLELAGRGANRGPFVVIRKRLISRSSAISEGRDTNYRWGETEKMGRSAGLGWAGL